MTVTRTTGTYDETWTTNDLAQYWTNGVGGSAHCTEVKDSSTGHWNDSNPGQWIEDGSGHTNYWMGWLFSAQDPIPYDYQNQYGPGYTAWSGDGNWYGLNRPLGCESCALTNIYTISMVSDDDSYSYMLHRTYKRKAQTTMALLSGGRAIPGQPVLHKITGWVRHIPQAHFDAQPGYVDVINSIPQFYRDQPTVPNASVHLFVNSTLHDEPNVPYYTNPPQNGSLYYVTPAGAGPIDCTPTVYGDDFYTWGVNAVYPDLNNDPSFSDYPHVLSITANGLALDPDGVAPGADYCVGQYLTFALPLPGGVGSTGYNWSLGGDFYNADTNSGPNCSTDPIVNPSLLTSNQTTAWFVSGNFSPPDVCSAFADCTLVFYNGNPPIHVGVNGLFNMYRPTVTVTTITTNVAVDNDWRNHSGEHLLALHYGTSEPEKQQGITFSGHITVPEGLGYDSEWVQVINSTFAKLDDIDVVTNCSHVLDTVDPYPPNPDSTSPPTTSDSPGLPLPLDGFQSGSEGFDASMWLMFTPDGGHRVPLNRVDWYWSGIATNNGTTWSLTTHSNNTNPAGVYTEEYPSWTNNVINFKRH